MPRLLAERPPEKSEEPAAEVAAPAQQGEQPSAQRLLSLQKTAGNAAVTRYLRSLRSDRAGPETALDEHDGASGPKDAPAPQPRLLTSPPRPGATAQRRLPHPSPS